MKSKPSKQQEKANLCQALIEKTIGKLADQLESGCSDAMKRYLKAMSSFHAYSINNLFLIMGQKPDATRVAGYRTWMKLNRQVKKGERGIRIMAPVIIKQNINSMMSQDSDNKQLDDRVVYFRTVCVFDVSQTDGSPLPELAQAQGDARTIIPKLENAIRDAGIKLEYADTGDALGKSLKGRILIKTGMSSAETFSTLAHEYAHELLHQSRERIEERTIRELEADAVACVVCEHMGISAMQANADYIQLWDGNKEKLLERMERIKTCSMEIIQRMEGRSAHSNPHHSEIM